VLILDSFQDKVCHWNVPKCKHFDFYGIQVPSSTQPLFTVLPIALRNTRFSPTKPPLKVSVTFSVILLPKVLTDDPAPASVHWLLETWTAEPGVCGASIGIEMQFIARRIVDHRAGPV
jgi:hypothetical protein